MSRELYATPNARIQVSGEDNLIYTWVVKSNVKEQQENDRYLFAAKKMWIEFQQIAAKESALWGIIDSSTATTDEKQAAKNEMKQLREQSAKIQLEISKVEIGLMKEALVEIYGMDYNYAWIGYAGEPPEESEEHFFPWPIGNEQYPGKLEVCYFVTKIYWPEKVADWSSLRDDNGMYPGSRVAQAWCEKTGITIGVNRPTGSSVGELAIALANADRVYTALAEAE